MRTYYPILLGLFVLACNTSSNNTSLDSPSNDDSLKLVQLARQAAKEQVAYTGNPELSKSYFYELSSQGDSTALYITSKADTFTGHSIVFLGNGPLSSTTCRSYITGFHANDEAIDGDYGDLVIEDFNFDGLEDVAVKSEMSKSGARYVYYLQKSAGKFEKDNFLSEDVSFFPTLDKKKKTLVVASWASANTIHRAEYVYKNGKDWEVLVDTIIEN